MPATVSRPVLALPGSLRRDGFNQRLLEVAATLAPPHVHVKVFDALAEVPLFDEDLEQATGGGTAGVRRLRAAVAAADGLIIATPEYNQSLPGVLKNALDWLSRPAPDEVLAGLPVAIAGASPGRWGTRLAQAALRQVLTATESLVMPAPAVFVRDAAALFGVDGPLEDAATRASLQGWVDAFARWLETCAPAVPA